MTTMDTTLNNINSQIFAINHVPVIYHLKNIIWIIKNLTMRCKRFKLKSTIKIDGCSGK